DAESRREFLADASALANTVGGVILYGIETYRDAAGSDTGIAKRATGTGSINVDREQQRLLSMLKDGLSPALTSGVALQTICVAGADGPVLALGIGRSIVGPHMVTFRGSGK